MLEGSVNSLSFNVGCSNVLSIHALSDELLDVLLADDDRAAVKDDNELLLAGYCAATVSLPAAVPEAAVENESAEIGFEVLKEIHIEKSFDCYQEDLGDFRFPNEGLKVCWRVSPCKMKIAPSSASGPSSCPVIPRSHERVWSIPTRISGSFFMRSL